jgi:hypothetical protein
MTLWLPEDEGAQLRFEFETEMRGWRRPDSLGPLDAPVPHGSS